MLISLKIKLPHFGLINPCKRLTNTVTKRNYSMIENRGRQPTVRRPEAARRGILPGPQPFIAIRPATFFFSMEDMQQYTAEMILTLFYVLRHHYSRKKAFNFGEDLSLFWSSPLICPKKGLSFWRRPFVFGSLEWRRRAGTLLGMD